MRKNKEIKNKNNKKRKSKLWFEDQHWIHVQEAFSQFVDNHAKQHSEERPIHPLTKRRWLKKEQNKINIT